MNVQLEKISSKFICTQLKLYLHFKSSPLSWLQTPFNRIQKWTEKEKLRQKRKVGEAVKMNSLKIQCKNFDYEKHNFSSRAKQFSNLIVY